MGKIARQPFVIVRVVVDLVGQEKPLLHMGMIDARGRLLVPDGIVVALGFDVEVLPRHAATVDKVGNLLINPA